MSNFRVKSNWKTILNDVTNGFKHANVTGISAIPSIHLSNDPRPGTKTSGEVVLKLARRGRSKRIGLYRTELYLLEGYTAFADKSNDPPNEVTLDEMMAEYERVFDWNNNQPDKIFIYDIIDSIETPPYTAGKHTWIVEAYRKGVKADGS